MSIQETHQRENNVLNKDSILNKPYLQQRNNINKDHQLNSIKQNQ